MAGLYSRTILVRHQQISTNEPTAVSDGEPAIPRGDIVPSAERRAAMFRYVFDWHSGDFE